MLNSYSSSEYRDPDHQGGKLVRNAAAGFPKHETRASAAARRTEARIPRTPENHATHDSAAETAPQPSTERRKQWIKLADDLKGRLEEVANQDSPKAGTSAAGGGNTILERARKHIPQEHAEEIDKALKGVEKADAVRRKLEAVVENSDNPSGDRIVAFINENKKLFGFLIFGIILVSALGPFGLVLLAIAFVVSLMKKSA